MFEMKYDRDGRPLPVEQPVSQVPEPEPVLQADAAVEPQEESSAVEENLQQETQEVAQQEPQKVVKESSKEQNLRNLREKAERLERERDEALKIAQQFQSQYQKPQQQVAEEEDLQIAINPDDLVEGKHLSKFEKKIQKLESKLKQYEQQSSQMALEAQLKAQYPDFDKVVSRENVEALREADPDLAEAIHYTADLHKKAVLAYKMIKKLGIAQEDHYVQEKVIAQKNAAKPKPLASISPQQGDSPLSHANAFANGLTPELKRQLQKEMDEARRRS